MRAPHLTIFVVCGLALAATSRSTAQSDPGRRVLAADDGFAALGEGTTGGASADAATCSSSATAPSSWRP